MVNAAYIDSFKTYLSRARRALASGSFPTTVLGLLEDDIQTTLPSINLFTPGRGPLYQDLKDMLCAWVVSRSDEGLGYVVGISKIAAMVLINMSPVQGFIVMRNLLERHCLRSFYGGIGSKDDVSGDRSADSPVRLTLESLGRSVLQVSRLPSCTITHLTTCRIFDTLLADGMPKSALTVS